jgi:copper resistance protein C
MPATAQSRAPRAAPDPTRRRRTLVRTLVVAALCTIGLALGASPAFAHTRLESSDPADGATLDTAPSTITLTFNESIPAEFAQITVVGPDGTNHSTGSVTGADTAVSTTVPALGGAGRYEIGYRVVSDDGHPITGSLSFTLTAAAVPTTVAAPTGPAPAAPAASAPTADAAHEEANAGGGAPVWPWVLGAVVAVVGAVVAALRLGRA